MAVTIEEARAAVLEHARVLGSEEVYLDDALGRALADDASAPNDVPPFAASAMDGFAIRAADTLDGSAMVSTDIGSRARVAGAFR
jgi:molybdopterin molybdotransferase